jgi:hypothetical protein
LSNGLNIIFNLLSRDSKMKPNNFAMRDWHLEHVEKVILRYIKGLSDDATSFEKRNFKKYGNVVSCFKQIEYDMKHGVSAEEIIEVMQKIRQDDSYSEFRQIHEAVQRLDDLERQLISPKRVTRW